MSKAAPSNYVIWEQEIVPGACSLSGMTGFADDWKLLYGTPVAGEFPAQARFTLNPDYPKDTALTDHLYNIDMLIVASAALRALLEAAQPKALEYLPVPIYNKKRAVPEPYCIVHPIDPVDCLDVAACKPRYDAMLKTEIDRVKKLVIDERRIPPERLLFRPKGYARVILAHRRLAEQIDAAGLTGIRWVEISQHPEV